MALSANRSTRRSGDDVHPTIVSYPIIDNVHVYRGGLVGIDASGRCGPMTTARLKCVGVADEEVDNTIVGHAAALFNVRVRQGVFSLPCGAGVDAITVADIGHTCYASDDTTVNRTSSNGARPPAGVVLGVESTGYIWVQIMLDSPNEEDENLLMLPAADNFAAATFPGVYIYSDSGTAKLKACAAGVAAVGVLQNTPVAGAIAKAKVSGLSTAYASGTINVGELCAPDASGQFKKAVGITAPTNSTSNASFATGVAITAGSANNAFTMLILPQGSTPLTGV